jgi:hypothetical protein
LLEKPLGKLMERTTASRAARQGGQTVFFDDENMSDLPSLEVDDGTGFGMSEGPEMFAGLEWLSGSLF